jgi:hypothetical protein
MDLPPVPTNVRNGYYRQLNLEIPSPLVKSPPWIMKSLMTRWKEDPSYPKPFSPVARARKFSAVYRLLEHVNSWTSIAAYLWNGFSVKTNHDTTKWFITMFDIKVDLIELLARFWFRSIDMLTHFMGNLWTLGCFRSLS